VHTVNLDTYSAIPAQTELNPAGAGDLLQWESLK